MKPCGEPYEDRVRLGEVLLLAREPAERADGFVVCEGYVVARFVCMVSIDTLVATAAAVADCVAPWP